MSKKIHVTDCAPAPVGPYSQAVEVAGFVYCSGQIPLDAKTGEVFTGDIKEQTRRVMENVKAVLLCADLVFDDVIKTTIFLTDMKDFSQVNEIYAQYFKMSPPARSCVEVSALPKGVDVEIEVIAKRH
ncbi:MAG: RidA family protein [Bdellovibrionales bacterium]|nr:RidA family protein [Bdellovibrionales bacterium]